MPQFFPLCDWVIRPVEEYCVHTLLVPVDHPFLGSQSVHLPGAIIQEAHPPNRFMGWVCPITTAEVGDRAIAAIDSCHEQVLHSCECLANAFLHLATEHDRSHA